MASRGYVAKKRRASIGQDEEVITAVVNQPSGGQGLPATHGGTEPVIQQAAMQPDGYGPQTALAIRRPHAGLPNVPSAVEISHRSFEDDYVLGDELGRGTFSTVRKCTFKTTGETRAVKIIDTRRFRLSQTFRATSVLDEVRILRGLDHPGIIQVYEVYDRSSMGQPSAAQGPSGQSHLPGECILIVTELAPGGELFDSIIKAGNFTEPQARHVVWQVLDALRYLHDRGVVHRDLKPENILVTDTIFVPAMDPVVRPGRPYPRTANEAKALTDADPSHTSYTPMLNVKIADFGVARYVGNAAYNAGATTFVGSPQYVAPEVLFSREYYNQQRAGGEAGSAGGTPVGTPTTPSYGRSVDVYSLGVIVYVMLAGYLPFDDGAPPPNDAASQERAAAVLQAKRAAAARNGATQQQLAQMQLNWEDRVKNGLFFMAPPVWTHVSEAGKDLIRHLMEADPAKRFTVHAAMAHPWFEPVRAALEARQEARPGPGPAMPGPMFGAPMGRVPLPIAMPGAQAGFPSQQQAALAGQHGYAQRLLAQAGQGYGYGYGPMGMGMGMGMGGFSSSAPLALTDAVAAGQGSGFAHGAQSAYSAVAAVNSQRGGQPVGPMPGMTGPGGMMGRDDVRMGGLGGGANGSFGTPGAETSSSAATPLSGGAEFHIDATAGHKQHPGNMGMGMGTGNMGMGGMGGMGGAGFEMPSSHSMGMGMGMGMGGLLDAMPGIGMGSHDLSAANRQMDVLRAVASSINFSALLQMQQEVAATFYAAYASVRAIPQAALIVRAHAAAARDLQRQVRKVVLTCRSLAMSILEIMPDLQDCVMEGDLQGTHGIFERMGHWVRELKSEAASMQNSYGDLIVRVQTSLEQAKVLSMDGHAHGMAAAGGQGSGPGLDSPAAHRHGYAQWLPGSDVRSDALVVVGQRGPHEGVFALSGSTPRFGVQHQSSQGSTARDGASVGMGPRHDSKTAEETDIIRRLHANTSRQSSQGSDVGMSTTLGSPLSPRAATGSGGLPSSSPPTVMQGDVNSHTNMPHAHGGPVPENLSHDELLELFLATPNVVADDAKLKRMLGRVDQGTANAPGMQPASAPAAPHMRAPASVTSVSAALPSMLASMSVATPVAGQGAASTFSPRAQGGVGAAFAASRAGLSSIAEGPTPPATSSPARFGSGLSASSGPSVMGNSAADVLMARPAAMYYGQGQANGMPMDTHSGPSSLAGSPLRGAVPSGVPRSREESVSSLGDVHMGVPAHGLHFGLPGTQPQLHGITGTASPGLEAPSSVWSGAGRRSSSPVPVTPASATAGGSGAGSPIKGHTHHTHRHATAGSATPDGRDAARPGSTVGEGATDAQAGDPNTALDTRPDACLGCALDGLRAVDRVLTHAVEFWTSMELVIDMLVRRKEHSQTLLETSTSARMVAKALSSLSDYTFFWRAFAVLCGRYAETIGGSEGQMMYAWLLATDEQFESARPVASVLPLAWDGPPGAPMSVPGTALAPLARHGGPIPGMGPQAASRYMPAGPVGLGPQAQAGAGSAGQRDVGMTDPSQQLGRQLPVSMPA